MSDVPNIGMTPSQMTGGVGGKHRNMYFAHLFKLRTC